MKDEQGCARNHGGRNRKPDLTSTPDTGKIRICMVGFVFFGQKICGLE